MNAFNHQSIVTAAYSLDAYNRCIPYRLSKEDKDQSGEKEKCIEVLMISSPNRDDLVFPKGGWEDDGTVLQAASREALEEAGVKGTLNAGKSPWILGIQKQKQTEHLQPGRRLQRQKTRSSRRWKIQRSLLPRQWQMRQVVKCQIMTPNCCAKPSSGQHHGMNAISPYPLGICLSRGCL
ncbi:hypothetical protein FH972_018019 [Carpinus fangiana]|uniref:Nudix hydrolase domain-containing protein n=1 Tax=Carpinus fangiana TaxID=176857 RepID=A0A5N6RKP3_9ROSI|nr:hypothetical protein FH972_018019 [Carpinus fangiana]